MNNFKNKMGQGSSANYFIYQESYKDSSDQFDTVVEKYKKLVEKELEQKKVLGFIHKQDRVEKIDYIFVTLRSTESVSFATDILVQEPCCSKFWRYLFCIKDQI